MPNAAVGIAPVFIKLKTSVVEFPAIIAAVKSPTNPPPMASKTPDRFYKGPPRKIPTGIRIT
jgi:hypothetical protein